MMMMMMIVFAHYFMYYYDHVGEVKYKFLLLKCTNDVLA